jgi:hypothetical protein
MTKYIRRSSLQKHTKLRLQKSFTSKRTILPIKKSVINIFLSIILMMAYSIAIAQMGCIIKADNIPQIVLDAFKEKYPDVVVKRWRKTKENYYDAKFNHRNALFNTEGKWIETRMTIKIIRIPKEIRESIEKTEYRSWKINEVIKLESAGKSTLFILRVEKGNDFFAEPQYELSKKMREIYFDPNGAFVKKVDLTPDNNFW